MTNDPRSGRTALHASHDPILIAALAANDLAGGERESAEALVASCAECRSLAADLGAISRAVATDLPRPRRQRDFRLTEADARRLRGGPGWRTVLARLASPGFGLLQPLGGVAAALGLALLVATAGFPMMASSGAAPPAFEGASRQLTDGPGAAGGAPSPAATGADTANGAPEETTGTEAEATNVTTGIGATPGAQPAGGNDGVAPDDGEDETIGLTAEDFGAPSLPVGLLVGFTLLIAGLAAVVLRVLATRLARPG
jgi:hypothetical protein